MEKEISIRTNQFPKEIIEQASNSIRSYITVLLYGGKVIGSGTFVQYNSRCGILTAYHVIEERIGTNLFKNNSAGKLGVCIATNYIHTLEFELQHIRLHEIGTPHNGKYNECGPDLVFLEILDKYKLDTIIAYSNSLFWDISSKNNFVNDCYEDSNSLWAICGAPQDWTRDEMPNSNFDKVIGCKYLIDFTGIEKRFDKDGFDYFDITINHTQNDAPNTFYGMSGGGLWKVSLSFHSRTGNLHDLKISNTIFSGVIFYQIGKANPCILRSHGAKSIYEVLPKILEKSEHRS